MSLEKIQQWIFNFISITATPNKTFNSRCCTLHFWCKKKSSTLDQTERNYFKWIRKHQTNVSQLYILGTPEKKFTNPFLYAFVSFYRIFSPWGLNFVDSLFTSLWNNVSFNKQFTLIEIIDYLKVQVYRTLKIYLEPF